MPKQIFKILSLMTLAVFIGFTSVKAQDISQETVMSFVKDYLKEKAKYTGHVDLYDEKINKVRNLDLLSMDPEFKHENDQYSARGKFRDVASGDITTVKITVKNYEGKLELGGLVIEGVEQAAAAVDPNRTFNDEEVKEVISKYFTQKSKFTGTFDLFDDKTQKIRNLTIGNLQGNIRRFGTRFIGRVDAVDQAVNENLELDVSVDNKEGTLEVKSVKIFSVNKVQR